MKVLTSFAWASEAQVMKAYLESAGIDAQISEEHLSTIMPQMTAHAIHIVVPDEQFEEARALLAAAETTPAPGQEPKSPCHLGGEHEFTTETFSIRNIFRFLIGIFTVTSMRPAKGARTCKKCGQAA